MGTKQSKQSREYKIPVQIINNVFNQVGCIINEFVPEFYKSDLFNKRDILSIYTVMEHYYISDTQQSESFSIYPNLRNLEIKGYFVHLERLDIPWPQIRVFKAPEFSSCILNTLRNTPKYFGYKFTCLHTQAIERNGGVWPKIDNFEDLPEIDIFEDLLIPLKECKNLEVLHLQSFEGITLSSLSSCTKLRELKLEYFRGYYKVNTRRYRQGDLYESIFKHLEELPLEICYFAIKPEEFFALKKDIRIKVFERIPKIYFRKKLIGMESNYSLIFT